MMRACFVACAGACALLGCASRKTVTIRDGSASLIAYRDGTGAWTALPPSPDGAYQIDVTDDFQVVGVTAPPDGELQAEELDATADDGACWVLGAATPGCTGPWPPANPVMVHVTGQMLQAGEVEIGAARATGGAAPWSFDLTVPAGVHDLVAWPGPTGPTAQSSVVLRRDLDLTSDTTLPDIDLATQGIALATTPVTVDGASQPSMITVATFVAMPHDTAIIAAAAPGNAPTVMAPVVPASALDAGDSEQISLEASTQSAQLTVQGARATVTAGQALHVALTPPPCIEYHANGDQLSAAWCSSIDADDGIELWVGAESSPGAYENVVATRSWLAATGASSVAFDTSVPGYQPGWQIDLTQSYLRTVTTWTTTDDVAYMDMLSGTAQ